MVQQTGLDAFYVMCTGMDEFIMQNVSYFYQPHSVWMEEFVVD
jgi:hypothetical protein